MIFRSTIFILRHMKINNKGIYHKNTLSRVFLYFIVKISEYTLVCKFKISFYPI